jgi:hypothetical protein
MNPVDSGQRTGAWYVIKVDSGGQFSQYPDSYEDDENFVDADVEVWYIAGYSLPDDWPPTDGWTSANYHELTG